MKILIIGSEGFIGSKLQQFFSNMSYSVLGVDIIEQPVLNKYSYIKVSGLLSDWDELFKLGDFDTCINAAGSGNVANSFINPLADFEANTHDVIKILDSIKKHQPGCKYLHISSAAVYGNPLQLPIHETDELKPVSPYGFHKLMSEQICKEYHQLYGLPVTVIRPFSVYGAGLQKQLFWDTCQKVFQSSNNSISLYGTGNESRDFIFIDDLVTLIEVIIRKSPFRNDIYNAASGIETSIAEIAVQIQNCLPGAQINFSGESREGDPVNWCANINKIAGLGFKPQVNLTEGIKKYVEWFKMLHSIGN
jgi:dTDP-glucose 4,6-dehydratase/UDP-glucose 4-epimerase